MDDGIEKAPFSWWRDSVDDRCDSSSFQSIVLELDKNMQVLLTLVQEEEEEDGDYSFTKRAEMYYQKKKEVSKRVKDCHTLYRSVIENFDNLSLRSSPLPSPDSSTPDSGVEDLELELGIVEDTDERCSMLRLVEESSRHLVELTRSNEEKRETIRGLVEEKQRLVTQQQKLMEEHGALQMKLMSRSRSEELNISSVISSKACNKQNTSQLARLKNMVLSSLWGGLPN